VDSGRWRPGADSWRATTIGTVDVATTTTLPIPCGSYIDDRIIGGWHKRAYKGSGPDAGRDPGAGGGFGYGDSYAGYTYVYGIVPAGAVPGDPCAGPTPSECQDMMRPNPQ